jgi:hypothetical protein
VSTLDGVAALSTAATFSIADISTPLIRASTMCTIGIKPTFYLVGRRSILQNQYQVASSKVFGQDTIMLCPIEMQNKTVGAMINATQYGFAKTSTMW